MQTDREKSPLVQQRQGISLWTDLVRPCLAEYVGTTLFIFAGILSAFRAGATVDVAFGHGMALFVMVASTAAISGGHLNPAVTLGVFCTGTLSPIVAIGYIVAQLVGSITASGFAKTLIHYKSATFALTEPWSDETDAEALFTESFLTAILVLTVLTLAVETGGKNVLAPFAIGMAVAAGIFAGGDVSGASMNPARSFGPAVVFNKWGLASCLDLLYWRSNWCSSGFSGVPLHPVKSFSAYSHYWIHSAVACAATGEDMIGSTFSLYGTSTNP
jgi:MIP family channel proteins